MEKLHFIKPGAPIEECSIEFENHFDGFINSSTRESHRNKITTYVQNSSGTIVAGILAELNGSQLSIQGIWVNSSVRGYGVGKKLLTLLEKFAQEKLFSKITIKTTHHQLVEFYIHNGYEIVSNTLFEKNPNEMYTLEKPIAEIEQERNQENMLVK